MMHVINARNVNEALQLGMMTMISHEQNEAARIIAPRGRGTLELPGPMMTTYKRPRERVLFDSARDANPFFHFFEGLWMLAGRNDLAFLSHLLPAYADFSDDGWTVHGAYGHRMRGGPAWNGLPGTPMAAEPGNMYDQLTQVIRLLQDDPDTRRAVVQIWDYRVDMPKVEKGKDVPCNTQLYFKVRDEKLQMTILCRSNDMLWGAYGANAVHFSMIMEYVANKVGVDVGEMHQLSDSFHVYTSGKGGELWNRLRDSYSGISEDEYSIGECAPRSMTCNHPSWDEDNAKFFRWFDNSESVETLDVNLFTVPWFRSVVVPMWNAWKSRNLHVADCIGASDWSIVAHEWLRRRVIVATDESK